MKEHILTISRVADKTPSKSIPDGAITGNGYMTVTFRRKRKHNINVFSRRIK